MKRGSGQCFTHSRSYSGPNVFWLLEFNLSRAFNRQVTWSQPIVTCTMLMLWVWHRELVNWKPLNIWSNWVVDLCFYVQKTCLENFRVGMNLSSLWNSTGRMEQHNSQKIDLHLVFRRWWWRELCKSGFTVPCCCLCVWVCGCAERVIVGILPSLLFVCLLFSFFLFYLFSFLASLSWVLPQVSSC